MSTPQYFPVANPTVSFWHSEKDDEFKNIRTTPELPSETDILIIGGGYAGAAVGYWTYHEAGENPPKITLVESRFLASGATGRNGGHLKPDYYREYLKFEKDLGLKEAASIGNFEHDHLSALKQAIEELNIDCDFVLTRACNVHLTKKSVASCLKAMDALRKNPYSKVLDDIQVQIGKNAEITSICEDSPVSLTFTAGQLWPYKMVKGFLKYCIEKGMNVQTYTTVTKVEKQKDDTYIVTTNRGIIKTKKVVMATNAYTATLVPEFEDKIVPVKGTCSHIKVTDKHEHSPYLSNTYGICRDFSNHEYLINRPDGTIIVGGAKPYYLADKDSWYKNVDDSTLFKGDVKGWYSKFMQKNFYTWKNFETEVDYLWTGILGYSVDALPWIGEMPGSPNKYIVSGFHGHGMPRIFLSAKAIAEMMLNDIPVEMTGIPKPFMLNAERLAKAKNNILEETGYTKLSREQKL
ncbi:hypothetical protein C6P40_001460 [Pichia californica]|uniref:FAD dependent oxidoreductase domain-containing protein n=1 Tax=Pichia californica TaxID=460514 RepID=A0A9P6WJG4_9ASCO|nr:hypothetical protein C6P40_001460 [[Candida] californica]